MFAGQNDAAVDLTEVAVVRLSCFIRPVARAAERERNPVPGDRDAVLEFLRILRVDLSAEFDRAAHSLGCPLYAPFGTLSFLALPVIPELRITTQGVFDVRNQRFLAG